MSYFQILLKTVWCCKPNIRFEFKLDNLKLLYYKALGKSVWNPRNHQDFVLMKRRSTRCSNKEDNILVAFFCIRKTDVGKDEKPQN